MNGIFGIFGLGCGLYCLYAYCQLKFKKEINQTILLPKDARMKKCKDIDAYCKTIGTPLLFLGVIVTLYGISDLFNSYIGQIGFLFWIMFGLVWVALFWFMATLRKTNKKYFDI